MFQNLTYQDIAKPTSPDTTTAQRTRQHAVSDASDTRFQVQQHTVLNAARRVFTCKRTRFQTHAGARFQVQKTDRSPIITVPPKSVTRARVLTV